MWSKVVFQQFMRTHSLGLLFLLRIFKSCERRSGVSQPVQQEGWAVCLAYFSMYLNKLSSNKTKKFPSSISQKMDKT